MKFAILVFPGSNCDRDCAHVISRVLGASAEYVWHQSTDLKDADVVIIPGGFSYGDYLRTGAAAKLSPVMKSVVDFALRGGPVLGICNGFQILLECGLLPGAMLRNRSLNFVCKDVHIVCASARTPFTHTLHVRDVLRVPIAHAEGNYTIDEVGMAQLRENDQIVFQYSDSSGEVQEALNPNGSVENIAGICNKKGNVLGMMPHPERASELLLGSVDGLALFQAALSLHM